LQALDFGRMWIASSTTDLALQFAIAGGVDGSKRGTGGSESLRVGNTARGAEDAEKLIALAANTAEHAELLKNHGPGDDGKQQKQKKNAARDETGLRKDVNDIGGEEQDEQKNDEPLSVRECCVTAKRSTFFWARKT